MQEQSQKEALDRVREEKYKKIRDEIEELKNTNWEQILVSKATEVGFRGNFPRAIALLNAMTVGICDVLTAMLARNKVPVNFEMPRIVFSDRETLATTRPSLEFDSIQRKFVIKPSNILISVPDLERISLLDPGLIFQRKTPIRNELIEVGKPGDIFYLGGVEEAVHSVQMAVGISNSYEHLDSTKSDTYPLVEYDSQQMEYEALGWQIRMILDKKEKGVISSKYANILLEPIMARLKESISHRSLIIAN